MAVSGILRACARALTGRRAKYGALTVVVGLLALAGPLAGKLADLAEEGNGPTSTLPRGAQSTQLQDELPEFAVGGIAPVLVVTEREGGLTSSDREWAEDLRDEVSQYAEGGTLGDVRYSRDGEAASLTFGLDTDDPDSFDLIATTRDLLDDRPDGLAGHVTGPIATAYDQFSIFDGLNGRILLVSILVVTVVLLLTYRSPVLWLLPLLSIGVATAFSDGVIYLLAQHARMPVDSQSSGILTIFVFGVGTDYALLVIARYREQLLTTRDRHRAMAEALGRTAPTVLASAATVALALCCLVLADLNSTRSLGMVVAVGVGCTGVVMLTVLPLLLVLVGRWVFWPSVPRASSTSDPRRPSRSERRWQRIAAALSRAPRRYWVLTASALGVAALCTAALDLGPDNAEQFRTTPDSVVGQQVLSDHFAAGSAAPVQVAADAGAGDAVRRVIASQPGTDSVSQGRPSADGSRVLFGAVLTDAPDSQAAEDSVRALRNDLARVDGAAAVVGGPTAERIDVAAASRRDALTVIPAVLAVVLLVLLLLLRAVVGSLALLGTVLLTFGAALGTGGLVLRALGFEAADVSLPLLSFTLLVALGVDYTIFLMNRVREEVRLHGHADGVRRGLVATGGVVTSAGIVLAATFGVAWELPTVFIVGIGVVVSVGVLLDTFVTRSVLVPALALDLGGRFWWPACPVAPEPPSAGLSARTPGPAEEKAR